MMQTICEFCLYYTPAGDCPGFPDEDGIPDEIALGKFNHRLEYPGDGGYRFDPKPDAPDWVAEVWPE